MADLENNSVPTNLQENQHTPGPWEWNECVTIMTDGVLGNICIAEVYNRQWRHTPSDKTREANARLIAASPDLLAALEKILPLYEKQLRAQGYSDESIQTGQCGKARAAIAKAKGGAL